MVRCRDDSDQPRGGDNGNSNDSTDRKHRLGELVIQGTTIAPTGTFSARPSSRSIPGSARSRPAAPPENAPAPSSVAPSALTARWTMADIIPVDSPRESLLVSALPAAAAAVEEGGGGDSGGGAGATASTAAPEIEDLRVSASLSLQEVRVFCRPNATTPVPVCTPSPIAVRGSRSPRKHGREKTAENHPRGVGAYQPLRFEHEALVLQNVTVVPTIEIARPRAHIVTGTATLETPVATVQDVKDSTRSSRRQQVIDRARRTDPCNYRYPMASITRSMPTVGNRNLARSHPLNKQQRPAPTALLRKARSRDGEKIATGITGRSSPPPPLPPRVSSASLASQSTPLPGATRNNRLAAISHGAEAITTGEIPPPLPSRNLLPTLRYPSANDTTRSSPPPHEVSGTPPGSLGKGDPCYVCTFNKPNVLECRLAVETVTGVVDAGVAGWLNLRGKWETEEGSRATERAELMKSRELLQGKAI